MNLMLSEKRLWNDAFIFFISLPTHCHFPFPFLVSRSVVDTEVLHYTEEAFPKGHCAVYATSGKDSENMDTFELTAIISSAKLSPKNYWWLLFAVILVQLLNRAESVFFINFLHISNGRWRSIWRLTFTGDLQTIELKGFIKVDMLWVVMIFTCFSESYYVWRV